MSYGEIAGLFGCHANTVYRACKEPPEMNGIVAGSDLLRDGKLAAALLSDIEQYPELRRVIAEAVASWVHGKISDTEAMP